MLPRRRAWTPVMLLVTGLAAPAAAADAPQYERPQTRALADVVPPDLARGPHYRIGPTVLDDGYMHHFSVESDYGPFDVTGDVALWKLLREIAAITALRETKSTPLYTEGLAKAATAPPHFARDLALHPVDTLTGVPRGTFQILEDVSRGGTDKSKDARVEQAVKFLSWKRDYAYRAGLDPYTSNKVLQKELNSVAWAAIAGDWAVTEARFPKGGAVPTAVSSDAPADAVRSLLKEQPPQRLRTINDDKLKAIGIPQALRKRFLEHPLFTPTHDTWLVEALAGLGRLPGLDAFLQGAVTAGDEVEASFYVNVAQILRAYHQMSPLRRIHALNQRLIIAQAASGAAVVPLPVDALIWTERVDEVSRSLKASYKAGRIEMWTTGDISETARQELIRRGIVPFERLGGRLKIHE